MKLVSMLDGIHTKEQSIRLLNITNDTYVHIFEEYNARISDSLCNDLLGAAN